MSRGLLRGVIHALLIEAAFLLLLILWWSR